MVRARLLQVTNDLQYPITKDGVKVGKMEPYNIFLRNLIQENATHRNDSYDLCVYDLDQIDQFLFLSYLIDLEELESIRIETLMKEYGDLLQSEVDDHIDQVYYDDMREMHEHINGEL